MNNEYVIINKTALEKKIEELEKAQKENPFTEAIWAFAKQELKQLLSQSIPLIPEIEKSYDAGSHNHHSQYTEEYDNLKQKDISNLKLDI